MGRRSLSAVFTVGVLVALSALPAAADPIAGATYSGTAADGARLTFTVSPDGTIVQAYQVTGAHGHNCVISGEGDPGVWGGAPIENKSFDYESDVTSFKGTFSGAQSAAGTLRLSTGPGGCDTGVESWSATTAAKPPPGGGGPGGGNGGGGGGGHKYLSRVSLSKLSTRRLGGRIRTSGGPCLAGRTVVLWRGSRRMARTTSKAGGKFYFARKASVRGHRVRASVLSRTVRGGVCAAASSTFIRG